VHHHALDFAQSERLQTFGQRILEQVQLPSRSAAPSRRSGQVPPPRFQSP
jgi:hypothetical protein